MNSPQTHLVLRCHDFRSPYKAALSKTPEFLESVDAYVRELVAGALGSQPQIIAECWIRSKNDNPSSPELERLTRDYFYLEIRGFAVDQGALVRAEVRFVPDTRTFTGRKRRDNIATDHFDLKPDGKFLGWFLDSARCAGCGVFPDVTSRYVECDLCGYVDYGDESVEAVRDRFRRAPETPALVAAIQGLFNAVRTEVDPVRATYLRYRLQQVSTVPAKAMDPLPW